MPAFIDLVGQTFGHWTVLARAPNQGKQTAYFCKCVCGTIRPVAANNLVNHRSTNCGCVASAHVAELRTKHGMYGHPAYVAWQHAIGRCGTPTNAAYKNYGGRGIKVCDEWRDSFDAFWKYMGATWQPGLTLDRIDVNGDYAPSNCRWVSRKVQNNNKRYHRYVDTPDGRMNVSQAAKRLGVDPELIRWRLAQGWSDKDALMPPNWRRLRGSDGRFIA